MNLALIFAILLVVLVGSLALGSLFWLLNRLLAPWFRSSATEKRDDT